MISIELHSLMASRGAADLFDSNLVSKLLKHRFKIVTEIIPEFCQNLAKIIKIQSKMESWRDLGPSRGPSERPGGLGIDFWLILGSISGGILELKFMKIVKKSIWEASKRPQKRNTLLDGFQHRLLIDFWPILELFLEGFLDTFWGSLTRAR